MPKSSKSSTDTKRRGWGFLAYEDSAPPDWRERLRDLRLPGAISPCHDMDVMETGELKKPHFHGFILYPGPTTYSVALEDLQSALTKTGLSTIEPVRSVQAMYSYLTHKNDPDKAQYDPSGIVTLNGFCLSDHVTLTVSELDKLAMNLLDLCEAQEIKDYCVLVRYLREREMFEEFRFARTNTMFLTNYLRSKWQVEREAALEDSIREERERRARENQTS